ncbi:MAG TPA: hypothetical protein VK968_06070, partial [Roseimicrobium sp.]|nr:hypothetical protein [Roseimicrobium sp.]
VAAEEAPVRPKVRSTALPGGSSIPTTSAVVAPPAPPLVEHSEPVFESVDRHRIEAPMEVVSTPEHYNDLGVRKYDILALIRRVKHHFQGPSTNNPKLINYLAAGSIQGLRPLRYEKRVARNRVVALALFLLLVLFGIFSILIRNR